MVSRAVRIVVCGARPCLRPGDAMDLGLGSLLGRFHRGQWLRQCGCAAGEVWELRAAMSMGRFWRDQGKRNEARDLLAPVYGWFNEGFDTLDLKEAKALLDELAS
jgi:hypothetical protein